MRVSIFIAGFIALVSFFCGSISFAETSASKTILVFDASGSMWGQIDGQPKITIARSVFDTVLKDWQPGNELGLIAYGHRRKGDCSDIEQIIAPGPVDATAFSAALKALNPKGKTPLSAAVKQAAETLKYEENKATVILVTDGLETCNADPCAVASELEKLGVDFTTHVIGFDLSEKESKAVRCVAENTGGQYFSASNAAELGTAMSVASKAATLAYNVLLHGKTRKDAKELQDGVSWEVYAYDHGKLADKYLTYTYATPASFALAPGKYRIKAVYGKAEITKDIEVKEEGLTEADLIFGTGTLIVSGRAGSQSQDPVGKEWDIFPIIGGQVSDKYIAYSYSVPGRFTLPAGKYRIKAMYGKAETFKDVEVKTDETTNIVIIFGTGKLVVSGLNSEASQKPVGKEWDIYPIRNGEVSDKYIAYTYNTPARFTLPAGKYRIKAMYGKAVTFKDVEIKTDETTQTIIIFNTGYLTVSGRNNKTSQKPVGKEWDIYPIRNGEVSDKYIAYTYNTPANFTLPAGKYRIKGIYGKAVTVKDVEVKTDETTQTIVTFNTGYLTVSGRTRANPQKTVGKEWDIYPIRNGEVSDKYIAYTYSTPANFTLPAGKYRIKGIYGDKTYMKDITIKADEKNEVVMQFD
ncbi:MAG: VWA domain-containing protein [Robiginitomaculum sp.]|nr:VWA domain-containing protein [Robiginitomaculum sp.]MDQ7078166.1 VWA domain-containing protein [Robiginitomaculum sp.]